jgi:Ca2+-binding RTX toxin-like protein
VGASEDDLLFGNSNNDILTGEEGADAFSCGSGRDTITDFNAYEGDTSFYERPHTCRVTRTLIKRMYIV